MWNGPFSGMMGGWGGGWGWPFMVIFPLLFVAVIVTVIVLAVRYAIGLGGHTMGPGMMGHEMERRSPGLDALEERYARGEIDRDQYLQKKKDILG